VDDVRTYRWVCGPESADEAADAFDRFSRSRPAARLMTVATLVVLALVLQRVVAIDAPALRLLVSGLVALVIGGTVILLKRPISREVQRRRFRGQLKEGEEMSATFGADAVQLTGSLATTELSYDGFAVVERHGSWMVLMHRSSPLTVVWPAACFPEPELALLRARSATPA
jgi:hypothetical protein